MRIFSTILLTLLLTLSVFAQQKQNLREGSQAPVFAAAGMDGRTYDMNQLKGKVVVITFWSTRCGICHSEIPKLTKIAERYSQMGVVFLAVSTESPNLIGSYIRKTPFAYNHVPNGFGVLLQYADRDRGGNLNMGFPAHYVVDPDGKIDLITSGWAKSPQVESHVSRLVAAQGGRDSSTAAGSQK